jgi:hypothetical protein
MGADCELEIAQGTRCGIAAYERCAECRRAFCRSHQAWERTPDGTKRVTPIEDWCSDCQARSDERAEVRVAANQSRIDAAKVRIVVLIQQLDAAGFPGAAKRNIIETEKGSFGRTKTVKTEYDPAIPIGPVQWDHLYNIPREGWQHSSDRLETGITRRGEYVVMDPRFTRAGKNWMAKGHNFIGICAILEDHARKYLPGLRRSLLLLARVRYWMRLLRPRQRQEPRPRTDRH